MIGIIGAMEEEVSQLIEAMEEKEKVTCAGMDFYCGKLKDKEVVIVQSGIGKVNMALCTQILADRFDVKAVINTGVAGGLYKDIEIGDIVISKDAVLQLFLDIKLGKSLEWILLILRQIKI